MILNKKCDIISEDCILSFKNKSVYRLIKLNLL